jgi:DHA1 family tetracycline resistance protein-like MFS transporter
MATGHPTMQTVDLKPLLPLYLVIFVGFCGYSLMITLFVPMLMGADSFLSARPSAARLPAY